MWALYKKYFPFMVVSFFTSLLGSSVVHMYYQPLADFNELVDLEFEDLMKAYMAEKSEKEKGAEPPRT